MFVKEDWVQFRTLATLGQRAGVSTDQIPMLVAKELVDNALDESGTCSVELIEGNGFKVSDPGGGIPGDDDAVASLFSINRPLTSSKTLRSPRGALGNGLRVVTGAVVATGGSLVVSTRGRTLRLNHDHDSGDTRAVNEGPWDGQGTEIQVRLGPPLEVDREALEWAEKAIRLAGCKDYGGKSSPLWHDPEAFYELLQAAKGMKLREVVARFEGYSDRSAAVLLRNVGYNGELCRELDRSQALELLRALRQSVATPVLPRRLGRIGLLEGFSTHARVDGEVSIAGRERLNVSIPVAVEAWAAESRRFDITAFVNRTPITGETSLYKSDKEIIIRGCDMFEWFGGNHKPFELWFNVDSPYMPITTDGKAPNFGPFADLIKGACQKAAKGITREANRPKARKMTQAAAIFELLLECIAKASGNGAHPFKQRQVYYALRPLSQSIYGFIPEYDYFTSVVTDYENVNGEIPGMLRDPRGTIYHPHTGEEIPLGTLAVELYRRPEWLFCRVLYIEKEGFNLLLKDAQWPERHDCALLTSKGQGTRAAKDLIDLLAETDEPCEFFLIHDADAAGTMIYQCLQEATAARGARKVKIVNLGLEPEEGRRVGLEVEDVKYEKTQPTADYLPKGEHHWLQTHRIELNAMTTPQFLEWLDAKFAAHAKLVPPDEVMVSFLEDGVRERLEAKITEEVLEEAGIDDLVEEAMEDRSERIASLAGSIRDRVSKELEDKPALPWRDSVEGIADDVLE